jgi:hypothetical protein
VVLCFQVVVSAVFTFYVVEVRRAEIEIEIEGDDG